MQGQYFHSPGCCVQTWALMSDLQYIFLEATLTVLLLQATRRRVPTSSRPAALNATPSLRASPTRSALTYTVSSAARLVPSLASNTPMPTSRRLSPGARILWYAPIQKPPLPAGYILIWITVRVPREPQEVHPWHEDGFRWTEEGQGPERPDHVGLPVQDMPHNRC
jgi:hypothetical protein